MQANRQKERSWNFLRREISQPRLRFRDNGVVRLVLGAHALVVAAACGLRVEVGQALGAPGGVVCAAEVSGGARGVAVLMEDFSLPHCEVSLVTEGGGGTQESEGWGIFL